MSSIEFAAGEADDFERLIDHLLEYGVAEAGSRIADIVAAIDALERNPLIVRSAGAFDRELVIGRNAGCLKPLKVIIPEGSMLNPRPPASVYETISGGSGAGPGFAGTAVVQTHMTNSRLTDPEVLEFRFPVRLDSYEIRAGSGGVGAFRGGDGGIRRVRFLEPMTASILSNGRHHGAFGMAGGEAGAPGRSRAERADGELLELDHIASVEVGIGDVFMIETPGGGGYGAAPSEILDR